MTGKTKWTLELIKRRHEIISHPIRKILYCYGEYQDQYSELNDPLVVFIPTISELMQQIDGSDILIIIDDKLTELTQKDENLFLTKFFVQQVHHKMCSMIILLQNFFSKNMRTCSINCQYIALGDLKRDRSFITHLAKQVAPSNVPWIRDSYIETMAQPYQFLFLDFHPTTRQAHMIRSSVWPEQCKVYIP